jgi:hypothetical protein
LLYAFQAFVVFSCLYGIGWRVLWHYDVSGHPYGMAVCRIFDGMLWPMLWSFLAVSAALVFGSPFLIRRLGRAAIAGAVTGWLGLLGAGVIFFWR